MPRPTHPYLRTGTHWSYLAVVLDLYSRRVVGWTLSLSLATDGALEALERAMRERTRPAAWSFIMTVVTNTRALRTALLSLVEVAN
jgi:transposase InsO family protein